MPEWTENDKASLEAKIDELERYRNTLRDKLGRSGDIISVMRSLTTDPAMDIDGTELDVARKVKLRDNLFRQADALEN